jgi:hypothetical protein
MKTMAAIYCNYQRIVPVLVHVRLYLLYPSEIQLCQRRLTDV